jgi:hypothetical protein
MTYEVKFYGGSVELEADSCRLAIAAFEKTYPDYWHSVGPVNREVKSILPGQPEVELTHANYDRILGDEQGWEKNYRAAAMETFELEVLSNATLKKREKKIEKMKIGKIDGAPF